MNASSTALKSTADREFVTTRTFDAPRERVYIAWTDPKLIVKWWGPRGFTTTMERMDVRPGGSWKFTMHGPDGAHYPNESVYIEVVKPERLVYDHVSAPTFRSTVTFEDQNGKTTVTMRMVFESAEAFEACVRKYGAIEGAKQTFARLAELLAIPGVTDI